MSAAPRGPYKHILEAKGRDEVLAWAVERPDGGRGFGFTGGHFHRNWGDPNFRKLVLNAILWTAGLDVPPSGDRQRGDCRGTQAEPRSQVVRFSATEWGGQGSSQAYSCCRPADALCLIMQRLGPGEVPRLARPSLPAGGTRISLTLQPGVTDTTHSATRTLPWIGGASIFSTFTRNAQRSAASSICLVVGLPAPWPALVSIRISVGLSHDWAA